MAEASCPICGRQMVSDREYQIHLEDAHGLTDDAGTSSRVPEPELQEPAPPPPPTEREFDSSIVTPWGAIAAAAAQEPTKAGKTGLRSPLGIAVVLVVLAGLVVAALVFSRDTKNDGEGVAARTPVGSGNISSSGELEAWSDEITPHVTDALDLALTAAQHHGNYALYTEDEQIADCIAAGRSGDDLGFEPSGPNVEINRTVDRLADAIQQFGETCAEHLRGSADSDEYTTVSDEVGSAFEAWSAAMRRAGLLDS